MSDLEELKQKYINRTNEPWVWLVAIAEQFPALVAKVEAGERSGVGRNDRGGAMICPQTKAECRKFPDDCGLHGCELRYSCGLHPLPPKPTMGDIERLADESEACAALCWGLRRNSKRLDDAGKDYRAARAALMAAIKLYGEV